MHFPSSTSQYHNMITWFFFHVTLCFWFVFRQNLCAIMFIVITYHFKKRKKILDPLYDILLVSFYLLYFRCWHFDSYPYSIMELQLDLLLVTLKIYCLVRKCKKGMPLLHLDSNFLQNYCWWNCCLYVCIGR